MSDRSTQIRALASEQRLHILQHLRAPGNHFASQWSADPVGFGVCVTLIAEALGVSQPTTSRHVGLLRQAGFISVRRHQARAYRKRNDEALAGYLAWLADETGARPSSGRMRSGAG
jgi:DNA-binding transcriptional ArsR family regulator